MDSSRDKDLLHLYMGMYDKRLPMTVRRKAQLNFQSILIQVKDRELTRLRSHVIAAHRQGASAETIEHMTFRIKEYLRIRNRDKELIHANY